MPRGLRFALCFAMGVLLGSTLASAEPVGVVTKVMGEAQIGAATAVVSTPVHMGDRLRTGANARFQVTFRDSSSLTLGENANVVVDRYVFNPDKSTADVVLNATQGALRFAGGKIEQMQSEEYYRQHAQRCARGARHPFLGRAHSWEIWRAAPQGKRESEQTVTSAERAAFLSPLELQFEGRPETGPPTTKGFDQTFW